MSATAGVVLALDAGAMGTPRSVLGVPTSSRRRMWPSTVRAPGRHPADGHGRKPGLRAARGAVVKSPRPSSLPNRLNNPRKPQAELQQDDQVVIAWCQSHGAPGRTPRRPTTTRPSSSPARTTASTVKRSDRERSSTCPTRQSGPPTGDRSSSSPRRGAEQGWPFQGGSLVRPAALLLAEVVCDQPRRPPPDLLIGFEHELLPSTDRSKGDCVVWLSCPRASTA